MTRSTEVQKCTSTEKPGSTQSANTDGRLPGQTRQHLTFCHRAQMLLRPITCAPPFQHCDHMSPPPSPPPVSFSVSFPRVSIIVILDSGFAYIHVCKAKFACDWAYHAPTSNYVSYEGFSFSSRILFSALWRWKGDQVVDPLRKSWQHTSASTGGSEPAFNSFRLFSKIFYIHEALVEPSLNSFTSVT